MRTIFLDESGTVVQVISGRLDESSKAAFLRDYGILFNAVDLFEVDEETVVWVGGSYDPNSGIFTPPPPPEPEPTIEEILPE